MSKTSYSIYLDYKKAMKDAETIEHAAKKAKREASGIMDNYNTVSAAWKGENADKLKRKLLKLESKLSTMSKQLQKAAKTVRTIAESTYRSEQAALEMAKNRKV